MGLADDSDDEPWVFEWPDPETYVEFPPPRPKPKRPPPVYQMATPSDDDWFRPPHEPRGPFPVIRLVPPDYIHQRPPAPEPKSTPAEPKSKLAEPKSTPAGPKSTAAELKSKPAEPKSTPAGPKSKPAEPTPTGTKPPSGSLRTQSEPPSPMRMKVHVSCARPQSGMGTCSQPRRRGRSPPS